MNPDLILLEPHADADLPAGEFAEWLSGMQRALSGQAESDVPCGECNACCRSSYFIELKPADDAARERIPAALLFDAPGAPAGYQVLGHDEAGRCPMLEAVGACGIYADRPRTCRTFDCRVFAATGIAEAGAEKAAVTERAARWRFSYGDEESRALHQRLKSAVRILVEMQQGQGAELLPRTATQLAFLAVTLSGRLDELAPRLLADDDGNRTEVRSALLEAARTALLPPG